MSLNREAIMVALAARLSSIPGVVTFARRFKPWNEVGAALQPAVFLVGGNEHAKADRMRPTIWTLKPTLYLYCRNDSDPSASGSTALNQILQAIEGALERTAGEVSTPNGPFQDPSDSPHTTLGGLVDSVLISGEIETDEGLLQNQCVAIVPIEIIATS